MEQNRDADINIASEHFSGDLSQCNMVSTKVEEASYENNLIISFKKTTKKANYKLLDHIKGLSKIWIKSCLIHWKLTSIVEKHTFPRVIKKPINYA